MSTTKIIIGLVIIAAVGLIGYAVYDYKQAGELGSRLKGEIELRTLAKKTACSLDSKL